MHIGFYLDEWREGGVPAFIHRALSGLEKRGDRTTLFLARPHPKREKVARQLYHSLREELGERCVSLDLLTYPPHWSKSHLVETIAASGVRCLFASQFRSQQSALRELAQHVPIAGIAHNDLDYYYQEYIECRSFLAAEIAVSETVLEQCRRETPAADQAKILHIPYGVETGERAESARPPALSVIYCSRLDTSQKRSLDVIPIWKSFLDQGGHGTLTIIGSGKEREAMETELAGQIAGGTVRFAGQLAESDVYRAMAGGDVILNLSEFEGLPQTVLEGTALGLWPLLSDTKSGHPEIVGTLGFGTICPIGDPAAFTRELLGLAHQVSNLRHSRATRATEAAQIYSLHKCLEAYHDLAEKLARNFTHRGPPAPYRPRLSERLRRSFLLANYSRHMH